MGGSLSSQPNSLVIAAHLHQSADCFASFFHFSLAVHSQQKTQLKKLPAAVDDRDDCPMPACASSPARPFVCPSIPFHPLWLFLLLSRVFGVIVFSRSHSIPSFPFSSILRVFFLIGTTHLLLLFSARARQFPSPLVVVVVVIPRQLTVFFLTVCFPPTFALNSFDGRTGAAKCVKKI